MKYSVVVPVFNEEESVARLHGEIIQTMDSLDGEYEVIFINDGSSDGTSAALHSLSPITVIEFRKNFGQTAAMDAGIKEASGELIITLDGDGQNPPSEIPKLLKHMGETGVDIVSGWRKNRKDTFFKRFTSRGANMMRGVLVKDEIHDSGCSLKVYRRECFTDVDLFGEMHRFIPAVLSWSGFSISEIPVEHRAREFGSTKYNWRRVIKGTIDMIAVWFWRKYANRPLHLFGFAAFVMNGLGALIFAYLFVKRVIFGLPISESNLPLLAVFLVLLGIQFFISGILADIGIRNYYSQSRMPYSIKSVDKKA